MQFVLRSVSKRDEELRGCKKILFFLSIDLEWTFYFILVQSSFNSEGVAVVAIKLDVNLPGCW